MGLGYRPELDGLRALAALSVIVCHGASKMLPGFGMGVDVFFVLSGYLITTLLSAELADRGRIDYGDFLIRRMRRLYPALIAFALVMVPVISVLWPRARWEVPVAAFYAMNFARAFAHSGVVLGHTWSLALEFQFYLIWPLVLPAVLRLRSPILCLIASYVTLTVGRAFLDPDIAGNFRCTGLILGAIVAISGKRLEERWSLPLLVVIAAAMLAFGSAPASGWLHSAPLSIVELSSALLIAAMRVSSPLSWRPLVQLGKISYGIYLWHYPFALALNQLGTPEAVVIAISATSAIGLAAASWRYVERPFGLGRQALHLQLDHERAVNSGARRKP